MSLSRPAHTRLPRIVAAAVVATGAVALGPIGTAVADSATSPPQSPDRLPGGQAGSCPPVPFERFSAGHLRGRQLAVRLQCRTSGRLSIVGRGARAPELAAAPFRCNGRRAKVTLKMPGAVVRRAGTPAGASVFAVIRARGQTSGTPLVISTRRHKRPRPAAQTAHWTGVPAASCVGRSQFDGGGGTHLVSVNLSNGFGASPGEWVYARAGILPYFHSLGRYGYWMWSWGYWYRVGSTNATGYDAGGNVHVIGGSGDVGRLTFLWGRYGEQAVFIPRNASSKAAIYAGNDRLGYRTDDVYSYATNASTDYTWCYFG